MKEIKIGKYSKEWYRNRLNNIRNFWTILITLGLGFLIACGIFLDSGSSNIVIFLLCLLFAMGSSSFIGLIMYATINAEIENNFDRMYENFIYNLIYKIRIRQNRKMKKWLI